jgi:hypothetical protein
MNRFARRVGTAAAATGVALMAVGCTGTAASTTAARALPSPFTITARYTAASLGLDHPVDLAIGLNGDLYVTDLSQRVTVVSPAGTVLRRWGKPGSGPGEFKFIPGDPTAPTDVQASIATGPSGNVYISDSGNARVQVFSPQGRFIRKFGKYGTSKGQFLRPFDLAVDAEGDVYVADDGAEMLSKFSSSGKVIWQIGGGINADPDLIGHHHVATIDAHGRLVVVNDDVEKVVYVDGSGHVVEAFSPDTSEFVGGNVCEATVDAVGNTFVSGCGSQPTGPTLVYNRANRIIAKWPGTTYSLLKSPVFGPRGEVYALATDGSILKLHITLPGA